MAGSAAGAVSALASLTGAGPAIAGQAADWWARWQSGSLRGFTTANLPSLDETTLRALQRTGANLARVGLHFRRGPAGYILADDDAAAVQVCLAHAERLGVGLVVLGLFDDAVEPQPLWRDAGLQRSFLRCWADFGSRFGNHRALAGIDLFNEPNPLLPDLAAAQRLWSTLAGTALAGLRASGCASPVVFEPVRGAQASALRGIAPLADPRVVYSIHFYTPHAITHQGVTPEWTRQIPYPASAQWQLGAWDSELGIGPIDRQRLKQELRLVRGFAERFRVPIYIGEFGCARWAPGGSTLRWVSDCVDLFNAEGWNWSFHSFRTWTGWDAEVDSEDPRHEARSADARVMRRLITAMAPGQQGSDRRGLKP